MAAIKKREDAAAARAANAAQVASAASPAPTEEGGEAGEQPKYVDRAAARREAFNQPHKPKEARWQPPWKLQQQQQAASAPPPPPPPPPTVQPNKDGIQESNVGSKLLEKMVSASRPLSNGTQLIRLMAGLEQGRGTGNVGLGHDDACHRRAIPARRRSRCLQRCATAAQLLPSDHADDHTQAWRSARARKSRAAMRLRTAPRLESG